MVTHGCLTCFGPLDAVTQHGNFGKEEHEEGVGCEISRSSSSVSRGLSGLQVGSLPRPLPTLRRPVLRPSNVWLLRTHKQQAQEMQKLAMKLGEGLDRPPGALMTLKAPCR